MWGFFIAANIILIMTTADLKVLLQNAIVATIDGGKEILDVYENEFDVEYKEDNSPLTVADKRAHNAIMKTLEKTGVPVLSEEGRAISFEERGKWPILWVVDPLDGTKEFIKRNGEFTVNIALVENGAPIMGVIYVPVEDTLYFGAEGVGSRRLKGAAAKIANNTLEDTLNTSDVLPQKQDRVFTMVGSRSHMSDETAQYFEGIKKEHPDAEIMSRGSSLKICMVAEGSADVYPRFAPTMEWDTAAGHGIAKYAGFEVVRPDDNLPLEYNKEDLLNPWFIVKKG